MSRAPITFPIELCAGAAVYVFRDEHGQPLYIGSTGGLFARIGTHLSIKGRPKASGAATVDVYPWFSLEAAQRLEQDLITEFRPTRNIRHNPDVPTAASVAGGQR